MNFDTEERIFTARRIFYIFIVAIAVLLIRYVWAIRKYHQARTNEKQHVQVPPSLPALIPYLGHAFTFARNTKKFITQATLYRDSLTSTKISLLGFNLYVFQDRKSVIDILRHPNLSSPMSLYVFGERFLFGMPRRGVAAYLADDSGPSARPFPGSNVAPEKRVDYILHKAFHHAWTGPFLGPASRRFMKTFDAHVGDIRLSERREWTPVDDVFLLFGRAVSSSVTETVFGPSLLKLNPDIIETAWALDQALPWLFRQVPAFLMPRPYRLRKKMSKQIQRWYAYSRQWFTESSVDPDGDGDPYWGSEIVRRLQRELLRDGDRGFIDDECFAAHDMGLIWGSNSNVIAAAMLVVYHVFQDATLLNRIRSEIHDRFVGPSFQLSDIDHRELIKLPLLSSVLAEVLRLYVDVLLIFSSPHEDVFVGHWRLPKGEKAIVSTSIAHRDKSIWNTRMGQFPLETFWADRFMVDPSDPLSGPVRPDAVRDHNPDGKEGPFYSTHGLEGAWIPFGGGPSACPGRFLAKTIIMATCVRLVTRFDVEMLSDSLQFEPMRFGLGVAKAKGPIPARIRPRG
ncbi:cytochrome P450 [Xylaria sp. CBS 124048]|nr:cytochrome P450 [Xylaria sp. CBS 124048]